MAGRGNWKEHRKRKKVSKAEGSGKTKSWRTSKMAA